MALGYTTQTNFYQFLGRHNHSFKISQSKTDQSRPPPRGAVTNFEIQGKFTKRVKKSGNFCLILVPSVQSYTHPREFRQRKHQSVISQYGKGLHRQNDCMITVVVRYFCSVSITEFFLCFFFVSWLRWTRDGLKQCASPAVALVWRICFSCSWILLERMERMCVFVCARAPELSSVLLFTMWFKNLMLPYVFFSVEPLPAKNVPLVGASFLM